jgi:hypothetical protein
MYPVESDWQPKGAKLSDKTARKEFGLTQDELVQAIRAGKLEYRLAAMHGSLFLRLLRREVEALAKTASSSGWRLSSRSCKIAVKLMKQLEK